MALLPKRRGEEEGSSTGSLRAEVNRVFDEFFGRGWLAGAFEGASWMPPLDVSETDGVIEVAAEVPGIEAADIEISLTGDVLTVKGRKKEQMHRERENYTRTERRYGSFERSIRLPSSVDPTKVKAVCKSGVLRITLEKEETKKPKAIEIKVG